MVTGPPCSARTGCGTANGLALLGGGVGLRGAVVSALAIAAANTAAQINKTATVTLLSARFRK
jgi:hypothetical protein